MGAVGRGKEADSRADVVDEPASGAEAADMRRLTWAKFGVYIGVSHIGRICKLRLASIKCCVEERRGGEHCDAVIPF